jgi:hypothetical protein
VKIYVAAVQALRKKERQGEVFHGNNHLYTHQVGSIKVTKIDDVSLVHAKRILVLASI